MQNVVCLKNKILPKAGSVKLALVLETVQSLGCQAGDNLNASKKKQKTSITLSINI